jgi:hypothetical protein
MLNKKGYVAIRSRHGSIKEHLKNQIPTPYSVVYRHGSTSLSSKKIEINTIESVKCSSNKLLMKQTFDGDNNPTYFYWDGKLWNGQWTDKQLLNIIDYPVLSKLQFRSKGIGMQKHEAGEDLTSIMTDIKTRFGSKNEKYLERYHNFSKEYRLHCALGQCFYSCRKARKQGNHDYFRNDSNCIWFTQFDDQGVVKDDFLLPDNWDEITAECCRLQKLIGLDITAFDVIISKKGSFKILECNSAPSIAEGTGKYYREIIPLIIEDKLK